MGTSWEVDFYDWMYLMDEDTLINRSSMSKLGVELGQVTLFFRRDPVAGANHEAGAAVTGSRAR